MDQISNILHAKAGSVHPPGADSHRTQMCLEDQPSTGKSAGVLRDIGNLPLVPHKAHVIHPQRALRLNAPSFLSPQSLELQPDYEHGRRSNGAPSPQKPHSGNLDVSEKPDYGFKARNDFCRVLPDEDDVHLLDIGSQDDEMMPDLSMPSFGVRVQGGSATPSTWRPLDAFMGNDMELRSSLDPCIDQDDVVNVDANKTVDYCDLTGNTEQMTCDTYELLLSSPTNGASQGFAKTPGPHMQATDTENPIGNQLNTRGKREPRTQLCSPKGSKTYQSKIHWTASSKTRIDLTRRPRR